MKRFLGCSLILASFAVLAGCSDGMSTPDRQAALPVVSFPRTLGSPIQHVIVVIQENRSFDNIFAGFPGADAPTSGLLHNGRRIQLHPIDFSVPDDGHLYETAVQQWDKGKMDGFDLFRPVINPFTRRDYNYAYLERSLVEPYWTMARHYVLADHMFPTELGPSFTAHLDLVAATTELGPDRFLVDAPSPIRTGPGYGGAHPWGCDAPEGTSTRVLHPPSDVEHLGPFPCFTQIRTLADGLDDAGVSWRYYAPSVDGGNLGGQVWSIFDAIRSVRYGPDWAANVASPETSVLQDIAAGRLPDVAWVVPDWQNSDHAGNGSNTGPSWVASIVNAVGSSSYWKSTAIVILWDDWGGWYDDVPPPSLQENLGLGIRVPCLIVSPYASQGYVAHQHYEFGSVLKFVEETFGLPSLGRTDARAVSLAGALDFAQPARPFERIPAPYPESYFMRSHPSGRRPDDD